MTDISSSSSPFRSYPQKSPKSATSAKRAADKLLGLMQRGPQSTAAVVVDTSYHASQGYVTATTNHVVVQVYSVPFGTVLPQMRIFIRQMGSHTTNRAYIFDGYAPNVSSMGTQGSLLVSQVMPAAPTSGIAQTATNVISSDVSMSTAKGYYWHCFFYLPVLPQATVTLMQMTSSGGAHVSLNYLPTGFLQFIDDTGHGYTTLAAVPPHQVHWILIQGGYAGHEFLLDGAPAHYTGLIGGLGDKPVFAGGGTLYTLSYLSTITGTNVAPIGSWVSKMGYGTSWTGAVYIPLLTTIPQSDSDIPQYTLAASQSSYALYFCEDTPGSPTLADSSTYANALTLNTLATSVQTSGPY